MGPQAKRGPGLGTTPSWAGPRMGGAPGRAWPRASAVFSLWHSPLRIDAPSQLRRIPRRCVKCKSGLKNPTVISDTRHPSEIP